MPIRLSRKKLYPKDWNQISHYIRFVRAKGRCECKGECGLHCTHPGPRRCEERHGEPAKWAKGKIVLTTAHLCHDESCIKKKHLKAMCQRCHLRYDAKHHALNAAQTRHDKKAIQDLFSEYPEINQC